MENAQTSPIPESISLKPQDDDDQPLTPSDARTFKICVGKAMYLSHHRPDIQHSVNCTLEINEKPDDNCNAKAQEAYPLFAWHK